MNATDQITDPRAIDWQTRSATARIPYPVVDGLPVNPVQPDLPEGQGELRHWGERPCADVAVFVTVAGLRWLLLGRRGDGHGWALPGGGVDDGESDLAGGLRELREEAGLLVDPARVGVSVGGARYVPDPRAARNAWMVTTLIVVDLGEQPNFPSAVAGSDVSAVWWFLAGGFGVLEAAVARIDPDGTVFAAHRGMLTELLGF